MKGLDAVEEAKRPTQKREFRVSERFSCDVPTSCQPPSAWQSGGRNWPARVRDASVGGLCLVLRRRFEPGAGLAIELPGADGGRPSTALVRVVHVKAEPGGLWAIGCSFISPLSDEELETLVGRVLVAPESPEKHPDEASVEGVYFRGKLPGGQVVKGRIRTLKLKGAWPLEANRTIRLRFSDLSGGDRGAKVRVDNCRFSDGRWVLECTFMGTPPAYLPPPSAGRLL